MINDQMRADYWAQMVDVRGMSDERLRERFHELSFEAKQMLLDDWKDTEDKRMQEVVKILTSEMEKSNLPVGIVNFQGMECELYPWYMREEGTPCLRIKDPKDIQKAYDHGFECVGYPDELVKSLTKEEYENLKKHCVCSNGTGNA